jgi:serine/threonine protein phosphatase PrpC
MIHELRKDPQNSLKDISKKIADECCTDYYSKDNITLIIVDLKKYLAEYQMKMI